MEKMIVLYFYAIAQYIKTPQEYGKLKLSPEEICSCFKIAHQLPAKIYSGVQDALYGS